MSVGGLSVALAAAVLAVAAPPASAIVGGEPAQGEFPAFAQLLIDGRTECGGSLVRPQWILTAAHCVSGTSPEQLEVIVGSKLREQGPRIAVRRHTQHPRFGEDNLPALKTTWDVALVELEHPAGAPPIGFAAPALYPAGTPALAIGLGSSGYLTGAYREQLHQASLPVVADAECERSNAGRFDARLHICAGTVENESNVCQGDSGGPLMVRDAAGALALVGVVSFGTGCATPGTYSVFARAAAEPLRTWIEENLPRPPGPAQAAPATPVTSAQPAPPVLRLRAGRVRRGARRVRLHVSGPAKIVVRDSRGRILGRARAHAAGALAVRLRRPARRGRIVVAAGTARLVVLVR